METNGYSKTYVDRFKREIKKIISADSKEWACYNFLRGILKNLKLKLAMRLRAAGMLSKEK
jgi:hypothetical protein